ncbi:GstD1.2 family protein [Megaselia abdita]
MDLYYKLSSPACRAVLMTAEAINVSLNLKCVDFYKKSKCALELLRINPQFNIPTFVDGDLILTESRAIMIYLVERYASKDSLYPKCILKRAKVNQLLSFDLVFLYQQYKEYSLMKINGKHHNESLELLTEGLKSLDSLLVNKSYSTGEDLTLADLSLHATISSFEPSGINIGNMINLAKWCNIMDKEAPGNYINKKGNNELVAFFKSFT